MSSDRSASLSLAITPRPILGTESVSLMLLSMDSFCVAFHQGNQLSGLPSFSLFAPSLSFFITHESGPSSLMFARKRPPFIFVEIISSLFREFPCFCFFLILSTSSASAWSPLTVLCKSSLPSCVVRFLLFPLYLLSIRFQILFHFRLSNFHFKFF